MNIVLPVLVIAGLAAGIYFLGFRRGAKIAETGSIFAAGGIPAGKEAEFEEGTHPGEDGISVMYTLTTCRHCVHLKKFLDDNSIPHHLIYVDDFTGKARSDMMDVMRGHNPRGSFPTLVLPGGKTIVGFREKEIREAFNLPLPD